MAVIRKTPQTALLAGIKLYQWFVSPLIGQRCRFYPSCSHYATDALKKYGAIQGVWLTTKRLLKCHPWHPGGYDKVP
ncbi:MAG: membrane protein insertion efficiency factor YidD [Candidatus Berkiella sp.]